MTFRRQLGLCWRRNGDMVMLLHGCRWNQELQEGGAGKVWDWKTGQGLVFETERAIVADLQQQQQQQR